MRFPDKETVEMIRKEYPVGTRIELLKMDDIQAPPVGTKGTVKGVDDAGNLVVAWDNGCGLNVVYGEDIVKKLDTVTTVCYGEKEVWDSREEAVNFFLRAIAGSEGSECERYKNIYIMLITGEKICADETD